MPGPPCRRTPTSTTLRTGDAPRSLVFFDLDGTITRHDTLTPYVLGFVQRRPWRALRLPLLLPTLLRYLLGRSDRGALKGALVHAALGGASRASIERWTQRFVSHLLERGVFAEALATIARHRARGDRLVLMSASVDLYVPEIAAQLGFDDTICSQVAWRGERLDGRLASPNRRDEEKARCLQVEAARHPALPAIAYGNSEADFPHLVLASHAVLVNARSTLRRKAAELGIECRDWS